MLGEMLSILPVFAFEEGKMVSVEKVKNFRLLLENYQEFVDEFNDLDQVALVQSQPPLIHETHSLREHVNSSFPGTPFIELTINLALAALFGPAAVGIFAIEGRD
jgi:fatty acid-binding protein DegV